MKLYPGKIDNILVSLQKAGFVINYHVETNTVCDTSNLLQHEERLIYKIQCLCVNTKEIYSIVNHCFIWGFEYSKQRGEVRIRGWNNGNDDIFLPYEIRGIGIGTILFNLIVDGVI